MGGDKIPAFAGSDGTLGIMILKFDSRDEMTEKMNNMDDKVKVILE